MMIVTLGHLLTWQRNQLCQPLSELCDDCDIRTFADMAAQAALTAAQPTLITSKTQPLLRAKCKSEFPANCFATVNLLWFSFSFIFVFVWCMYRCVC